MRSRREALMKGTRRAKGFRTLALNALIAVAAVLAEVADVPGLHHLIGEINAGKFIAAVAVLNIVLRCVTTTPVGRKD